jgi:tRNA(Ile)-lysidine synthase
VAGPAPAVAAVRRVVRSCLADLIGLPGAPLVLVACSGGPDSLALAHATAFVAARSELRAGVVRVDQGWSALPPLDLPSGLDVVRTVPGHAPRTEDAARRARYAALEQAAAELGAVAVLLGHTRDDQAETVLLGLGRGSGPRSIAGMAAVDGRYLRPLLNLRRQTTEDACAALGLPVWRDPHNSDPAFQRARLRAEVLPLLDDVLQGGVSEALARTAALLRDDLDALDALAAAHLDDLVLASPPSEVARRGQLEVAAVASLPGALRTRVLRQWAHDGGAQPLTAERTAALDALVTDWHGQGPVQLPGPVSVRRSSGTLVLSAEPSVPQE